jgi:MFS family permease
MHASACAYALPALLPDVAAELNLDDGQSAGLTFAFTLTYSLLLIPAGAAADALDRRQLLAAGVGLWSAGTALAAVAPSYPVLLASRLLYAAGYAVQNPVCFGMIPELFPRNRASAMAAYNVAIHLGRAISFGGGALASPAAAARAADAAAASAAAAAAPMPAADGSSTLPLDALARVGVGVLGGLTILYLSADALVLSPPGGGGSGIDAQLPDSASVAHAGLHVLNFASAAGLDWRGVLLLLAAPGPLLLAPLLLTTVRDPGRVGRTSRAARRGARRARGAASPSAASLSAADASAAGEQPPPPPPALTASAADKWGGTLRAVLASSPWRLATAAAVLNDFGAWALVGFQATLYERDFHLAAGTYSLALAVILPLAGLAGGLGGSAAVDALAARGAKRQRRVLLASCNAAAAPVMAASLLAPDWRVSLAALLPALALAEVWRAPTALLVRDAGPRGAPGAATAAHLACRNALAGLGPLAAAWLARGGDLRHALLITPAAFAVAASLFWAAEVALDEQTAATAAAAAGGGDGKEVQP